MFIRRQVGINYDIGFFQPLSVNVVDKKYLPSALVGADYDPNVAIMVDLGVASEAVLLLSMLYNGDLSLTNLGHSIGLSAFIGMVSGAVRTIAERCSFSKAAEEAPGILKLS